jgi:hypothetical protein
MNDPQDIIFAIVLICCTVGGFCLGIGSGKGQMQKQAIELGVGRYHPTTAEFEFWKE